MPTSWASASWVCSALLLAGCGGGPGLAASGFAPGQGMEDVPDRRTGGSIEPVPTWRVEGGDASFTVTVRNDGEDTVQVVGVARDEVGDDQQFAPTGLDLPVELRAGTGMQVEVRGRAECNGRGPGQLSEKSAQRFRLAGGETVDVELGALIEFVCPR